MADFTFNLGSISRPSFGPAENNYREKSGSLGTDRKLIEDERYIQGTKLQLDVAAKGHVSNIVNVGEVGADVGDDHPRELGSSCTAIAKSRRGIPVFC